MLYYVAHRYGGNSRNLKRARSITRELQLEDLDNTYICPLTVFSHLRYNEIGADEEMALCLDLLSACDGLIVASKVSPGVQKEIEFAEAVGMEVIYLED